MLLTLTATFIIIALCVAIHYEFLYRLSDFICSLGISHRGRIVTGVLLALCAHILAIWIFGAGYFMALSAPSMGGFSGTPVTGLMDCIYFSFITYSTLGFGDIVPYGWLRFMVGVEAMLGLVSIAWTASYLYFQMEQVWRQDSK